ncbi:putative chaperone for protein-folding within the ER, fungal [Lyophyllum shimeji]|uniref:Protein ROT1 n=1 Tax=Lyophyllum shimeji TaxID=47721 RepID=A0A9P3UMQ5_LYOSH|nr:putative chaperone for protein-folding within the ER, fungal [Lyophyllum shimeji]
MILNPLLCLVLASFAPAAWSQDILYDLEHNATSIVGTWSSGSKNVVTGAAFANPANMSFNYPKTTGISYSFSDNGWYEIARYRFNGNGSEPTCITGVIGWVHGHYTLNPNGSITMVPAGDGYQQIQDPCAAESNFIEDYNMTEYYQQWRIFQDPTTGYKLHLFQFDGAPLAPQFQVSTTPNMLPTQQLRNRPTTTESAGNGVKKPSRRSLEKKSNDAGAGHHLAIGLSAAAGMVALSIASLLL